MGLDQQAEYSRQIVSRYIIPDHGRGRTGFHYKGEQVKYMLSKHNALGMAMKGFTGKVPDDK